MSGRPTGHMRRLKTRAEFLAVARGKRAGRGGIVLQAARTGVDNTGVGFTVTKKAGNAPERNRIKRRLRAAVEACTGAFSTQHDYVVIGRRDVLSTPFVSLVSTLEGLIARVHASSSKHRPDQKAHAREP